MTIPVKLNYIDKHVFVSNHQQFYSGSRKIIECLHFSFSLFIDKLHKLPFLLKPQLYIYMVLFELKLLAPTFFSFLLTNYFLGEPEPLHFISGNCITVQTNGLFIKIFFRLVHHFPMHHSSHGQQHLKIKNKIICNAFCHNLQLKVFDLINWFSNFQSLQ